MRENAKSGYEFPGSDLWLISNSEKYFNLNTKLSTQANNISKGKLNVKFVRVVINGINGGEDISEISPEGFSELINKRSVSLPCIGAGVSGLVLSGEGVAAVFLFGPENNTVKVAFDVVKGALTLPGLGFLAGVVTIGSGIALIFLSKKTKDNSKYNDSLIKNGGSGEPPKVK